MAMLLLILKILLIAVLSILGLVLFILLLILFVPFRYSGRGSFYGEPEAVFSASWLLRLFRFDLLYKEKKLTKEIILFGFRLKNSRKEKGEEKDSGKDGEEKEKKPGALKSNEALLKDDRFRYALDKALRKTAKMIRHILPKHLEGQILFGMEEPDSTGKILALLAVMLPVHRNAVTITPDFSRKIFEGRAELKGRIFLIVPVSLAVMILLDKNVRFVMKEYKKNKNNKEADHV